MCIDHDIDVYEADAARAAEFQCWALSLDLDSECDCSVQGREARLL